VQTVVDCRENVYLCCAKIAGPPFGVGEIKDVLEPKLLGNMPALVELHREALTFPAMKRAVRP
jgi:hypothetical protein